MKSVCVRHRRACPPSTAVQISAVQFEAVAGSESFGCGRMDVDRAGVRRVRRWGGALAWDAAGMLTGGRFPGAWGVPGRGGGSGAAGVEDPRDERRVLNHEAREGKSQGAAGIGCADLQRPWTPNGRGPNDTSAALRSGAGERRPWGERSRVSGRAGRSYSPLSSPSSPSSPPTTFGFTASKSVISTIQSPSPLFFSLK